MEKENLRCIMGYSDQVSLMRSCDLPPVMHTV